MLAPTNSSGSGSTGGGTVVVVVVVVVDVLEAVVVVVDVVVEVVVGEEEVSDLGRLEAGLDEFVRGGRAAVEHEIGARELQYERAAEPLGRGRGRARGRSRKRARSVDSPSHRREIRARGP